MGFEEESAEMSASGCADSGGRPSGQPAAETGYDARVIEADCDSHDEDARLALGDDDPRDAALHERILSEDAAWNGGFLAVNRLDVELPNGVRATREVVRHPGASAVVALTSTGKVVLVRQFRTALDRVTVEIPAGKLDPGEDPAECARRELREETGFTPREIRYLTSIVTSCGFCDEIIHIYLATGLELSGACPDEDEFVNVDLVPLSELIDAVLDGKIEDAKTVVGALACDAIAHRLGGGE